MKNYSLRELTQIALFATLIFLGVQLFRIQLGHQFVHFGNALVVVGCLVFGSKKGAIAATLGLGIFDILNGYAAEVWITILESLIVCWGIHLVYEKTLHQNDKTSNIIGIGILAAVIKIILNLVKYTFLRGMIMGGLAFTPAFVAAFTKILGTFGSAAFTVITVPILYPIFKKIYQKIKA